MAAAPTAPVDPNDDVRHRILVTARSEFAARGLAGASVRSIAGRAGVTAAMINYYFRGKRGLYDEVVDEVMTGLLARLQQTLATDAGGQQELAVRLAGAYFDFLATERDHQRLVMREVLDRGEGVTSYARRYLLPLRALLDGQLGGERTFQLAVSLFGAVAGYFLYEPVLVEMLEDDPLSPERLAARRRHIEELATRMAAAFGSDSAS